MPEVTETSNQNKALVHAWFRALGDSDYPAMRELLTEDFELSVSPSVRGGSAVGRDDVMARIVRVFSSGRYYEPGTLACNVLDIIAEGDKTVAHVIMSARFPNGNSYENIYLVLMYWRAGKMSYQLELFDAAHWAEQHKATSGPPKNVPSSA